MKIPFNVELFWTVREIVKDWFGESYVLGGVGGSFSGRCLEMTKYDMFIST